MATFGASVDTPSVDEFMRIWRMHPQQSVGGFLTTLDCQPEAFLPSIARVGLGLDELMWPQQDPRFQRLLADETFSALLRVQLANKRSLLLRYLAQEREGTDSTRLFVVDIGWRGTIQDNLALCLPTTAVTGVYLALYPFLNAQPKNCTKIAYISDGYPDGAALLRRLEGCQIAIEMFLHSDLGSVVRYHENNGMIEAERVMDPSESHIHECFTRDFQAGVLRGVGAHLARIAQDPRGASVLVAPIMEQLAWVCTHPHPSLALPYFALTHNELFGGGRFISKRPTRVFRDILAVPFHPPTCKRFWSEVLSSGWPAGYLAIHRLGFLRPVLSFLYRDPNRGRKSDIIAQLWARLWFGTLISLAVEIMSFLLRRRKRET